MRNSFFILMLMGSVSMPALVVTPSRAQSSLQGPVRIGTEVQIEIVSPDFKPMAGSLQTAPVWVEEVRVEQASYIAPHFGSFTLPDGAWLVIRSPDHERSWIYEGHGKADRPLAGGFWGIHIPGPVAIIEMYSSVAVPSGAVTIDRYAHGYPIPEASARMAICGTDDSEWARCYQSSEPTIYDNARAVARLSINGSIACTGWLVGDDGHLITNSHCIKSASDALNTDYEFMAEGSTCSTDCATRRGCAGVVEETSGTLVQANDQLDYSLIKLPARLANTYGFMRLRNTGATLGERIYIPQHPAAWGKRIGVLSTSPQNPSGFCEVDSLDEPPCSEGNIPDVGYFCDTRGGSSGAPVLAYRDHCVVALHHCARCANRGVPIDAIIRDLGSNLPRNALCRAGPALSSGARQEP